MSHEVAVLKASRQGARVLFQEEKRRRLCFLDAMMQIPSRCS